MTTYYSEVFSVDMKHSDAAYRLFDAWKAQGKDPHIMTTTTMVTVAYTSVNITVDRENDDEDTV